MSDSKQLFQAGCPPDLLLWPLQCWQRRPLEGKRGKSESQCIYCMSQTQHTQHLHQRQHNDENSWEYLGKQEHMGMSLFLMVPDVRSICRICALMNWEREIPFSSQFPSQPAELINQFRLQSPCPCSPGNMACEWVQLARTIQAPLQRATLGAKTLVSVRRHHCKTRWYSQEMP